MRKGLHPLSVHIAMAAAEMARRGVESVDTDFANVLRGIQKYERIAHTRKNLPLEEIWRSGEVSLNRVPGFEKSDGGVPLLLIPSMINRSSILDLTEERSMLRYYCANGLDAYLLDWGESLSDGGQADLTAAIVQRLLPAAAFLRSEYGRRVHGFGYCMGGTMLLGAASYAPDDFASLSVLAAPWDFHAGARRLQNRVQFWAPSAYQMMDEGGVLSQDWLQTIFATIDPVLTYEKFIRFAEMEEGAAEEALFIAVEDWLNDGVDLPAPLARECIQGWFMENTPMGGTWKIGGHIVRPDVLDLPVQLIASKQDRLVDYESAIAALPLLRHGTLLEPGCGHIGMIAGRRAVEQVWAPAAKWIFAR